MDLQGSQVIIIGGSSGMGLATAQLAKERGAVVTIASRSAEKLHHAANQLGDVRTVVADMTSETDVGTIFHDLDRVDHVFISAGGWFGARVMEGDLDTFRSDVAQRIWGPLYIVRHAVPKMARGSFTFLTGEAASKPADGAAVTCALLAGLEMLVKGFALELAPIRVNAIAPGMIDTPIRGDHRAEAAKWAADNLPVQRIGMAEEVAQAAVLLMTTGFITGEILHIDGGGRLL
jgi:NAD(P)-dependent dehydrogenase (short-subunit alcohol dehydrogenase family)